MDDDDAWALILGAFRGRGSHAAVKGEVKFLSVVLGKFHAGRRHGRRSLAEPKPGQREPGRLQGSGHLEVGLQ